MAAGHDHHHASANQRAMKIALVLTTTFMLVELVGGILTRSLALISDAAHMFTDCAALAIALAAMQIAKRPADKARTFGYYRFEILAAAFNALLLFAVALYILYEAYTRLRAPAEIESMGMLAIAVTGLVVNLVSMRLLGSGKDKSLNVKAAYLEVWSDLLGSIAVIVGAAIIAVTGWPWVDSVVAVLIGLWVLPRTWVLLKSSLNILLEGTPENIDIDAVQAMLLSVPGVLSIHDLHIWALTSGKVSLTVHIVNEPTVDAELQILPTVREGLARRFGITHVTIQCELTPCGQAEQLEHFLEPASNPMHAHRSGPREHEHGNPHQG